MKVTVFDSNLSAMLSPDEEALLGEIFFSLDVAREHPAVQHCLRDIQHQSFKVKNTLNAYTVFGKIWSYAIRKHTNFHSSGTVYRAKKAYLVHTGVLDALVKEFNVCRRNGGKTQNHQRVQRGGETPETQSQSSFPGPSSLPLPDTFDDPVATATTMTAQQFDVAPAVQYSVYSSSEAPVDPLTFAPGFSSIPSTSYSSSSGPNPYPLPVSYVPSPPDVGSAGAWGGHHDPPPSSDTTMYFSLNDVYHMQPAVPNEYSGNQFTEAGPSQFAQHHHGGSVPTQYQNGFGGNYGVQDVQLYSNQVHTGYDPKLEQNQEEDYYGDVYETFH